MQNFLCEDKFGIHPFVKVDIFMIFWNFYVNFVLL